MPITPSHDPADAAPAVPATLVTAPTRPDPGLRVLPVAGIPEVRAGDDLADLILVALADGGPELCDGDVLCVSTKIVSKALGLVIDPEDKQRAIREATVHLVARRRHIRTTTSVVEIPAGPVMAAAGIDGSNAPGGMLLLPEDPDAEAEALHAELVARTGKHLAVVLTDTSSRIWRIGVGDVALGAAGLRAVQDLRGRADADGRTLHVTQRALADELAAAADLVKGKAEAVPLAIVRGVPDAVVDPAEAVPARALSRTGPDDWFRRPSLESVWQAMGVAAADEPVAAMSPEDDAVRLERAIDVARSVAASSARIEQVGPGAVVVHPASATPQDLAEAGALGERLRIAMGAESIARALPTVSITIGEAP